MLSLRYPMEVNLVGDGGNVAPAAQSKRRSKVARGGRKASRGVGAPGRPGDAAAHIVQSAARRVGDMALIGHLCHRPASIRSQNQGRVSEDV